MTKTVLTALALVAALSAPAVYAHGTKAGKDDHKASTDVVKEQKPWGIAGDATQVSRTIDVSMMDSMEFQPSSLTIKQGETIRFIANNQGQVLHEFVLGTSATNDEHAKMMIKFPGMEHDEPYMAHVGPDEQGEIIWTFNQAGDFDFACLIAGHYQAGMRGTISVLSGS
ncbi:cupredoxin domain-containing protein [Granulosicoccus antarcticus]|uniref:Auracyanin-B n=1 Tax=Granulosicoccus antarcticus IMCC3135 TaxID=1192854 RepID=A0A2Z2NQP1_9GAMM|nr:cupredoxin family protein [Granulosicoccus antarcticus]ASJ73712.1 Auracyanin-B [Granulosicoccus antarcticus IMCC3135]